MAEQLGTADMNDEKKKRRPHSHNHRRTVSEQPRRRNGSGWWTERSGTSTRAYAQTPLPQSPSSSSSSERSEGRRQTRSRRHSRRSTRQPVHRAQPKAHKINWSERRHGPCRGTCSSAGKSTPDYSVFETTDGVLYAPFRRAIWPCPHKHDVPPEQPMSRSVSNHRVQRPCSGHSRDGLPDYTVKETHGMLYSPFRRVIWPCPHKHATVPTIVNDLPRRPVAPRAPRVHKQTPPPSSSHLEPIPSLYYPTIRRPVPLLPRAVRRPAQRVHVVHNYSSSSSTDRSATGHCDDDNETEVQLDY